MVFEDTYVWLSRKDWGRKWSTLHLPCFTYLICRHLRESLCFNGQTKTFDLFWNLSVAGIKNTNPIMECEDIYLSETGINLTCFHPTITVPSPHVCNHHQNHKILMICALIKLLFSFILCMFSPIELTWSGLTRSWQCLFVFSPCLFSWPSQLTYSEASWKSVGMK